MDESKVLDMSPTTRAQQLGGGQHGIQQASGVGHEHFEDPLVSSDDKCPLVPRPG